MQNNTDTKQRHLKQHDREHLSGSIFWLILAFILLLLAVAAVSILIAIVVDFFGGPPVITVFLQTKSELLDLHMSREITIE